MYYCPRCGITVEGEHSWHLGVLIVLLVIFTLAGLIYMLVKWKHRCPRCKLPVENLMPPVAGWAPAAYLPPYGYAAPAAAYPVAFGPPTGYAGALAPTPTNYPTCNAALQWVEEHSRWWCSVERRYL